MIFHKYSLPLQFAYSRHHICRWDSGCKANTSASSQIMEL